MFFDHLFLLSDLFSSLVASAWLARIFDVENEWLTNRGEEEEIPSVVF